MAILLADVGGTNARLAIADENGIDAASVTRFSNDDHASFDDVVRLYLGQQGQPRLSAACLAVAGPVSAGRAELTNRGWCFDEARLAVLTGASRVRLINDLTALGYATQVLKGDSLAPLRRAPPDRPRNGQSLAVGLGTGFNVCAVRVMPGCAPVALEAEEGHTSLPANIHARLEQTVGAAAMKGFFSTEETFAGRGLSRLHAALTGQPAISGEKIDAAAAAGDPAANATYDLFVELVGLLCRELALRFMPLEGMFLAGSVGRSIADRMQHFDAGFLSQTHMRQIPENTPIFLILDDMAALHGCLRALT